MRFVKWTLIALLSLIVLLVLVVTLLVGTQAGSRWVLGQVPGVEVDGFAGRLGGAWHADQLIWAAGDQRVTVVQPALDWSPSCLFRLTLCIQRLAAHRIDLAFPPSEPSEPSTGPIELPDIKLPLRLEVHQVDLGEVYLNGDRQLVRGTLAARWNEDGLYIEQLTAQRDDLDAQLSGTVALSGQWPLSLQGQVNLSGPGDKPWSIALQANGDVKDEVRLDAQSTGYLEGELKGWVKPLDEALPARLRLTADRFKAVETLPDTLMLNALELVAEGTLTGGYRILGTSVLPSTDGPVKLALDGDVDANSAHIRALELLANGQRHVRLDGTVNWQDALAADARIDWKDFPWQSLYPEVEEPPVAVRRLAGNVSYKDGRYDGRLDADLDGPAGAFTLNTPIQGDDTQVLLPALSLKAGQGAVEGRLQVGFADGISWDTQLTVSQFDPSYWVAELPGQLAGPIRSRGRLSDGVVDADADIALQGRLRAQPTRLAVKGAGKGQRWTLDTLAFQLGNNRIDGQGALDESLKGQLKLALENLGQLWPGLTGRIDGTATASGTLERPQATLALKGQRVGLEDNRLTALDLQARLDANQQATIALKSQGIALGETVLGDLAVNGRGNLDSQQADLALTGPLLQTTLALDGTLKDGHWRGRLSRGDVSTNGMDWRLQQPAAIERLADGQLTLGRHCWAYQASTLCMDDQRLTPDTAIRMRLRQFPLETFAQWLPDDFAWQGRLNADVNLDLPEAGPKGSVSIDAGSGTLRIRDGEQWHDFPYSRLSVTSQLTPQRVDSTVQFDGGQLGRLDLQATIDPRQENKALNGRFTLQGLDLSIGRPFAPMVDRLEGTLSGSGTLGGTLEAPLVNGRLQVADGQVAGSELPLQIQDLNLAATIQGERVNLDGSWRSGERGQGRLAGSFDWSAGTDLDLRISGTRLPVTVQPYAELEVEPDLRIGLAGNRLALSGTVSVPRGKIEVRELPPSTVQVSSDTVIVGEEAKEPTTPMQMAMDITVIVGQEKLAFSAFGLNANIAGRMHIGDNLDARGELNLNDGRFRAYGQRLTVRRARVLFTGPISQPFLDVEAIRTVDDVTAGIRLTGNAAAPETEIFSEPAMSQEQALSYLVLGRPLSTGQEDDNLLAQAALGLGLAGSSAYTGSVAERLGIQNFQLDTEGRGNATSVVASGELTDRLTLRYGVGVFEPANTIALRYELTRRIYLEAASGLASSLDIFYRRDF